MVNKGGRPKAAQAWASTMRHNLFVSYAENRDVHTALFLAGADATDLIFIAVREYIVRHGHPAGDPAVQRQTAIDGLGIERAAPVQRPVPMPVAVYTLPAPVTAVADSASSDLMRSQLDDA